MFRLEDCFGLQVGSFGFQSFRASGSSGSGYMMAVVLRFAVMVRSVSVKPFDVVAE